MILWSLVFKAPRSTYFQILCYVSAKFFNTLNATKLGKTRVAGVRAERDYSDFDDVKGESAEFEWNIFPGFTTLQLCDKINNPAEFIRTNTRNFHRKNSIYVYVQRHPPVKEKTTDNNVYGDADFVKTFAKRFGIGQWSFIGPSSEKKWYPSENSPQGEWDRIAEDMLLEFAKSGHPIFRATTPLSRGKLKSKGKRKSVHTTSVLNQIRLIQFIALFSLSISSVSTGQWQRYATNLWANQITRVNP